MAVNTYGAKFPRLFFAFKKRKEHDQFLFDEDNLILHVAGFNAKEKKESPCHLAR
jgi:hypothetical protein